MVKTSIYSWVFWIIQIQIYLLMIPMAMQYRKKRFKLLGTDENGDTYLLIALNRYPSEDGSNKYATEVGSTKIHLTLNTSEESKQGNKVQVDTPSGEKTLVYSEETPRIKNSINLNQ